MKKISVLTMLVPLAMVCSCQKHDTAAEQQLAQRKAELDSREKALDDREKALAEREKIVTRAARLPAGAQLRDPKKEAPSHLPPSASVPPGLSPPINTDLQATREKRMEEIRALRQQRLEAIQKMRAMGARANPAAGAPADTSGSGATNGSADTSGSASTSGSADTSASAGTGDQATSPSPSPTPQ